MNPLRSERNIEDFFQEQISSTGRESESLPQAKKYVKSMTNLKKR